MPTTLQHGRPTSPATTSPTVAGAAITATALTGGWNVPAARFRVRQFIKPLQQHGVTLAEWPAPLSAYPPLTRPLRPFWAVGSLAARLPGVADSYRSDVTLFQRELLSTFLTLEPLTRGPRVLDVDDAIWLNGDGRFATKLARLCDRIICGNAFLADYFGRIGPEVEIVPTGLDTTTYSPSPRRPFGPRRIGWIGTRQNLRYLELCQAPLGRVLRRHPGVDLMIVCDHPPPRFAEIPSERVRHVVWGQAMEVEALRSMSIGLMPLRDGLWERGKCSFKMLQYMSCAIPVVVSPIGMNAEVLRMGEVGFGPTTEQAWEDALETLLADAAVAERMGREGRRVVLQEFDIEVLAPRIAAALRATQ